MDRSAAVKQEVPPTCEIQEIEDERTCDTVAWFAEGYFPDEVFLAALDDHLPSWRQRYSRLALSSEQTIARPPTPARGHWKRVFNRWCDASAGERGAVPVTFIRIR